MLNLNILLRNYFFLKNYVTSGHAGGAVFHNVLYYQQLSITRNQVSLYANSYFESLPIVSSAFKLDSSMSVVIIPLLS